MGLRTFLISLLSVTGMAALATAALLWAVPAARPHALFAVGIAVLFAALCGALYIAGRHAVSSANKAAFIQLVMASVLGKMLAALIPLFIYRETARPENAWYVAVLLLLYVVYTAYEVWFMTRLART